MQDLQILTPALHTSDLESTMMKATVETTGLDSSLSNKSSKEIDHDKFKAKVCYKMYTSFFTHLN